MKRQRQGIRGSAAIGLPTVLTLFCLGAPAFAETLDDRHLPAVARTAAEASLVEVLLVPPSGFSFPEPGEDVAAGDMTVPARTDGTAFGQPSAALSAAGRREFDLGRVLFNKLWIAAPAEAKGSDGLGPLFNARSCQECHLRDGRGHPPEGEQDTALSMVLHLSVPGGTTPHAIEGWLATQAEPTYGHQMQDDAAPGQVAEGKIDIRYSEHRVTLSDGVEVFLRAPSYRIANQDHGPLAKDVMISARVAPQMIGMGLLEAIPAAEILARADPDDTDGDGISGRAQIVPSREFGVPMLGRFGLKAGTPTLREQTAAAFAADMGLSTTLHPQVSGDCTAAQPACLDAPNGAQSGDGGQEVSAERLDLVTVYARNLGVPARRGPGSRQVLRGKEIFHALNCSGCHAPKHVTHRVHGQAERSFQLIWPYTDLLLHDMGPGLADNRPEGRATGREWRTPPLWGIGLTAAVSGHTQFLHDGRARTLMEAILWHGGEAQAARDGVMTLPATDRAALIAFLQSL